MDVKELRKEQCAAIGHCIGRGLHCVKRNGDKAALHVAAVAVYRAAFVQLREDHPAEVGDVFLRAVGAAEVLGELGHTVQAGHFQQL